MQPTAKPRNTLEGTWDVWRSIAPVNESSCDWPRCTRLSINFSPYRESINFLPYCLQTTIGRFGRRNNQVRVVLPRKESSIDKIGREPLGPRANLRVFNNPEENLSSQRERRFSTNKFSIAALLSGNVLQEDIIEIYAPGERFDSDAFVFPVGAHVVAIILLS